MADPVPGEGDWVGRFFYESAVEQGWLEPESTGGGVRATEMAGLRLRLFAEADGRLVEIPDCLRLDRELLWIEKEAIRKELERLERARAVGE